MDQLVQETQEQKLEVGLLERHLALPIAGCRREGLPLDHSVTPRLCSTICG